MSDEFARGVAAAIAAVVVIVIIVSFAYGIGQSAGWKDGYRAGEDWCEATLRLRPYESAPQQGGGQ